MARRSDKDKSTRPLLKDDSRLFDDSYQAELEERKHAPVDCLGMTFANDEERRAYFLDRLREQLKDPAFRKIDGFPIGDDADILALSDPPYYTACPNPFMNDFLKVHGRPCDPSEPYNRKPFTADVSEGKNNPIYNAHSYHTKVPHRAIMRYILHYTEPGDVVFDGFCGTGMTAVAAQLCQCISEIESLGLSVTANGKIVSTGLPEGAESSSALGHAGIRHAVVNDISPAATFIAAAYNRNVTASSFNASATSTLGACESELGWLYSTVHPQSGSSGRINYTIWSDVFSCPECAVELVFWDIAVDSQAGRLRDVIHCSSCGASLTKTQLDRVWVTEFDHLLGTAVRVAKQVPVLINYSVSGTRYEKKPDSEDLETIERAKRILAEFDVPLFETPTGFNTEQPRASHGITHVHQFMTARNAIATAAVFGKDDEPALWKAHATIPVNTRMNRWPRQRGPLTGTLYVPSISYENNVFKVAANKCFPRDFVGSGLVTTGSLTTLPMPSDSVDYIFTDPPFGGNIMYSELNYLWEAWHRVFTDNRLEAIESSAHSKSFVEYQHLMLHCFKECYRILKPGRWMTVEFHNSKNSIWTAIQEALQHAGFVVADVRVLDKRQGSFKQITSAAAVKQDLVISAYKPNGGLEERFQLVAGTETGVWDFVRTHLKQLPVFVMKAGQAEPIAERKDFLLFDRMVAFHVQRGVTVPMSAAEFYEGLERRFADRDGMYFLTDQVAEYDRKRMTVKEVLQLELFVTDEATAIQWLKQQLTRKPQSFQDLHPQFLKEIGGWEKHEKPLELSVILEENFLRYDGKEDVPSQIHSYLSSNFKELRNKDKDDPTLQAKAKDRWYVPDPNKAGDLEKLRERSLLKEFDQYRQRSKKFKRNEKFRMEAVRAGFKKAWQERDYKTIISVAELIPENVLQEDPKLLMWYDQALTRTGGEA